MFWTRFWDQMYLYSIFIWHLHNTRQCKEYQMPTNIYLEWRLFISFIHANYFLLSYVTFWSKAGTTPICLHTYLTHCGPSSKALNLPAAPQAPNMVALCCSMCDEKNAENFFKYWLGTNKAKKYNFSKPLKIICNRAVKILNIKPIRSKHCYQENIIFENLF